MVGGDAGQLPIGKAVEPGVPDVGPDGGAAGQLQGHGGGAHLLLPRLRLPAEQLLVGGPEQIQQAGLLQGFRLRHAGENGIHRRLGGHLAAAMAAQSVRQDKDALLRRGPETVLVVVPAAAVRICVSTQLHGAHSRST